MGFLAWFLSAAAAGYAGYRLAARLFDRSFDRAVAAPIFCAAGVVLLAETLSLLRILNSPVHWFAAPLVAAGASALLNPKALKKKPSWNFLRFWPLRLVGVAYAGLFVLAVAVPPNTPDGLAYHLPRIFQYLARNSLDVFPSPDYRETLFPVNATLLMMWSCVLTHSDRLAALISWLAAVCGAVGVAGISTRLKFPRGLVALGAALALGFPQIGIQATSVLVDGISAWFCVAAVYFTLSFAQHTFTPYAVLAAISVGLAGGTKPLTWFMAPGLAMLYVLAAWRYRTLQLSNLAGMGGVILLGVGLFVGPQLVRNYRSTGHFVCEVSCVFVTFPNVRTFSANTMRLASDVIDTTDLPYPLDGIEDKLKREAQYIFTDNHWLNAPESTLIAAFFGFDYNERSDRFAWFGVAGDLIVLGSLSAMGWSLLRLTGSKRSALVWLGLAALPVGHTLIYLVTLRYQTAGRFFCAPMLCAVPLGIWGLWRILAKCSRLFRRMAWTFIAALPVTGSFMILLMNLDKPLIPTKNVPAIWQLQPEMQRWRGYPRVIPLEHFVATLPPSRIGSGTGTFVTEYALFGPHFEHFIMRYHDDFIDLEQAFARDHCDVIVILPRMLARVPAGMTVKPISADYFAVYPARTPR